MDVCPVLGLHVVGEGLPGHPPAERERIACRWRGCGAVRRLVLLGPRAETWQGAGLAWCGSRGCQNVREGGSKGS